MTARSRLVRRRAKVQEKGADRRPRFLAAGYPPPMLPNEADERIATVDRHCVILARTVDPVYQQSFDVRLETGQHGVARDEVRPRIERKARLRRARRTGVVSEDPLFRRTVKE